MDCSASLLPLLQRRLIDAFRGVHGVWLTGGAALGGYHLGHRRSLDLDWFTLESHTLEELSRRLMAWCVSEGATCTMVQEYPGFRRYRVTGGGESTLVDLVHELAAQVVPLDEKPLIDDVRVDPIRELLANKLAAVLGRGEVKDLVDLYFLDRSGVDPLSGLADAARKDGGMEPTTLAWVLSQVSLRTEGLMMEVPLNPQDLAAFRDGLVERLQRLTWPGSP